MKWINEQEAWEQERLDAAKIMIEDEMKSQKEKDLEAAEKYCDDHGFERTNVAEAFMCGVYHGRSNPIKPEVTKSDEERAKEYSKKQIENNSREAHKYCYADYLAGRLDERAEQSEDIKELLEAARDLFNKYDVGEATLGVWHRLDRAVTKFEVEK